MIGVEAEVVVPAAAVGLGDRHAEEAVLAGLGVDGPVHDSGLLELVEPGDDLVLHEGPEGLPEELVLFLVDLRHGQRVRRRQLTAAITDSGSGRSSGPSLRWMNATVPSDPITTSPPNWRVSSVGRLRRRQWPFAKSRR